MATNIAPSDLPEFKWSDGQRSSSLKAQYAAIVAKIDGSIGWYQSKRGWKRTFGTWLRVWAVIFVAGAAALPTAAELWGAGKWWAHSGAAPVLGIVAALLIGLDKLSGATSGWIRYILAETSLKELRDDFAAGYNLETGNWAGVAEPTIEQTRHALETLHGYLVRANEIVRDETNQWKAEFQSALQQIEESAKAASRRAEAARKKTAPKNGGRPTGKGASNPPAKAKKPDEPPKEELQKAR